MQVIQRRCPECQGRGLVQRGKYLRKCQACGGMLPWMGWKYFWFGNPGNGGPLLQPKGQTSVLYKVPPPSSTTTTTMMTGAQKAKAGVGVKQEGSEGSTD